MLTLTSKEIENELARRDFSYFIKRTFPQFKFSDFSLTVCKALEDFLQDIFDGKRPILIIEAPPQHGKSELASRRFPAFALGLNPELKIAACSYSADLASMMNKEVQQIMLNETYQEIFPESSLNPKRVSSIENQPLRNSEAFEIAGHRGRYFSTGVGGPLTGKTVDIGIIDDPIKNMSEARSPTVRATIESWYKTVFLTRLSANSGQLIMMTRWHLNDLVGFIKERYAQEIDRVKILSFKAINDDGEPLVPALHPLAQLLDMKATMSSQEWFALYQQSPVVEGGNLIKMAKFQRYKTAPQVFDALYITCDTAFSEKKSADNSAFLLTGIKGKDKYLLDLYCKKVTFVDLCRDLKSFYLKSQADYSRYCPLSSIYIENKGSGISLIQQLRAEGLPIMELFPTVHNEALKKDIVADKYTRFLEVEAEIDSGNVWIPESAHWLPEFERQCEAFTGGKQDEHDDVVDALIYSLKVSRKYGQTDWSQYKAAFRL